MPFDMAPQDKVLLASSTSHERVRWQGMIELVEGGAAPAEFRLLLEMAVAEGQVSGGGSTQTDDKVEISGSFAASGVTLEIVIHRSADLVFQCHGEIDGELASMVGAAALGCIYPDECACLGHRGNFRIYRV